jgi:hypothetical protein
LIDVGNWPKCEVPTDPEMLLLGVDRTYRGHHETNKRAAM